MKLQNKKTPLKFKFFGILMLFGLIILTGCKKLQMPKVTTTPITNLINNGIPYFLPEYRDRSPPRLILKSSRQSYECYSNKN